MKKIFTLVLFVGLFCSLTFAEGLTISQKDSEIPSFDEVWVYVLSGQEKDLIESAKYTDICYFSAGINCYGELYRIPKYDKIKKLRGRKHLVVDEVYDDAVMHLILEPSFGLQKKLIEDLVEAVKPYDGLQFDFEKLPTRDEELFLDFLKLVKKAIGNKMLSVCLPGITYEKAYFLDYDRVATIVDRVMIMGYEEHWAGAKPGPIASIPWCIKIANFMSSKMEKDKILIGIPCYGRAWADTPTARALKYTTMETLFINKEASEVKEEDGVPYFTYDEKVKVTVYYDDAESILKKMKAYRDCGITRIAFWRPGQEDKALWKYVNIAR